MDDYVDQETTYKITFLPTFRRYLQQEITAKAKPYCNDKDFDNLYNTESPYAPDCPYLPASNQLPCEQFEKSRLRF